MALGGFTRYKCVAIEMFTGDSGDTAEDHLFWRKRDYRHFGENTWSLTETGERSSNCWSVRAYLKIGAPETIIKRNISCNRY